ncbi:TlpA family protein disulfide reductase [Nonomuraea sp. SBT364]|uniref:TlpA family protein disulfide reductase n=1 Tax=Nonomuraea sp. SBT364 TaxID=1580530 RepID=UPI00066B9399|nr:hypothetical protein [Nonomuraea sp. SBT364]
MIALYVLICLVGAVAVLDLVLTVGVIRRLREHTQMFGEMTGSGAVMAEAGSEIAAFDAVATDGGRVENPKLVGVFSPGCPACEERMPLFMDRAAGYDRASVLAVVAGPDGAAAEYRGRLEPVAQVVVEPSGGAVTSALQVKAFPAFAVLDGSLVVASGTTLDALDAALIRV